MTVTPPLIERVLDAMKAKGLKKKDLAKAVKLGSSWVTKFLSGGLNELHEDHAKAIRELLEIELLDPVEKDAASQFSLQAHQMATLMDKDPIVADIGKGLLKLAEQRFNKAVRRSHIPVLHPKELIKVGAEISVIAHRYDQFQDPHYAKIALETIEYLRAFLRKREEVAEKKAAKKAAF